MTVYDIIKELGVTKGYSLLLGDCEIDLNSETIWIHNECSAWVVLDKDGKFDKKGECVIFPSKDNRDWEKELEEKRNQLLPFNTPVMVSEGDGRWCLRYYKKCRRCHVSKINSNGINWKHIVPASKFDFKADDLSINIKNSI